MRHSILLLLLFFTINHIHGQISIDSEPYALQNDLSSAGLSKEMVLNLSKNRIKTALQEDEIDIENGIPPRFGLKLEVDFNTKNSGEWIDLPNGDRLWRLFIKSPSAKSINLIYDKFHLPPGGVLHIYNPNMSHIIGGFTEMNNKGSSETPGKFATGLIYGDNVILEYYHPTDVKEEPVISVKGVIHGYKFINLLNVSKNKDIEEDYGDSGDCQVNINCAEGNNWQDEKRGVAMLLISDGTRWCTGSLVNNTAQDGTPYLLTADHCLTADGLDAGGDTNASQWMFYWNYEAPNCANPNTEPNFDVTTGATLRASRENTDFALFELVESPVDAGFNVFFNGWDRTTTPRQGGVGIHHPGGDVKKIATHNMVPVNGTAWGNDHWRVNWIETANGWSVTEGGSSGSPLFLNNGRIIGQLHGGSSVNCTDPENDPGEYGKFDLSWNGTSSNRRLRDWLDPLGTNQQNINGEFFTNTQIIGDDCACNSPNETYTVTNAPGALNWEFPTNLLTQVGVNGNSITIRANDQSVRGNATLIARNANNNVIVATKNIYVGKPASPYGNISGGTTVPYSSLENYNYYSTLDGATSYQWWLPYPYSSTNTVSTTPSRWARLYGSGTTKYLRSQVGPNNGLVQFMGVNKCGVGGAKTKYVTVTTSGGGNGGGAIPLTANIADLLIENNNEVSFQLFPNPTNQRISIMMSEVYRNSVSEISLFDFSGRLVYKTLNKNIEQIDLSTYDMGIYFIKINTINGSTTKSILVER